MNRKQKNIAGDILFIIIILLAVLFMFEDIIVDKKIISGSDLMPELYPAGALYAEQLKQFKIALWNPYIGLGFPAFADVANSMSHPINLVCFFLFPLGVAMTAAFVLCTFFCCVFVYIYARSTNMSYFASIFCAFAFSLGAPYIGQFAGNIAFIKAIMFLPLLFYCIEKMLFKSNLKNIVFLSISLALLMAGGHGQAIFASLLASGLYIMFNVIFSNLTFKNRLLPLRDFMLAFIIALLLSAIQLIPTLELKPQSLRSGPLDPMTMTTSSFTIAHLKTFLRPIRVYPYYNGILPLILLPFGILSIKRDKRILFYLLLLIFFFALSFGRSLLPLYEVLTHIPGFNSFRYCNRYMFVAIFFLILISGKGLDLIISVISRIKIYRFIKLNLKYSIALIVPLLLFIDLKKADEITTNVPPGDHPNYEKIKYEDYLKVTEGGLLKLLRQLQQENKLMRVATDFNRMPENILAQFKIPSFGVNRGSYSPLNLSRVQSIADVRIEEGHYKVLNSLGINYLVTYSNKVPDSDNWELIFSDVDRNFNLITETWFSRDSEIYVFKNKKAFPRIFMVSDMDSNLIESEKLKDTSLRYNIEVVEFLSDRVTLRTSQNKDAFLVMNDTYYPGWKAYIDGKKTKIYLANRACRAIFVPKGKHLMEFKYNPFSYRIGKYITLTSIFTILFFVIWSNSRSRFISRNQNRKDYKNV